MLCKTNNWDLLLLFLSTGKVASRGLRVCIFFSIRTLPIDGKFDANKKGKIQDNNKNDTFQDILIY